MWNGEALFQSKNERIGFSHTCVAIVSIVPSKPLPRLDWRPNCTTIKQKMLRTRTKWDKRKPSASFYNKIWSKFIRFISLCQHWCLPNCVTQSKFMCQWHCWQPRRGLVTKWTQPQRNSDSTNFLAFYVICSGVLPPSILFRGVEFSCRVQDGLKTQSPSICALIVLTRGPMWSTRTDSEAWKVLASDWSIYERSYAIGFLQNA